MTKPARALTTESGPRPPEPALRNFKSFNALNGKLRGPGVYPRLDYREQFKVAVGTTTYRNRRGSGVDGASSGVRRRRRADQRVIQASLKISPEPTSLHFVRDWA
jgi:hypothetical protein